MITFDIRITTEIIIGSLRIAAWPLTLIFFIKIFEKELKMFFDHVERW